MPYQRTNRIVERGRDGGVSSGNVESNLEEMMGFIRALEDRVDLLSSRQTGATPTETPTTTPAPTTPPAPRLFDRKRSGYKVNSSVPVVTTKTLLTQWVTDVNPSGPVTAVCLFNGHTRALGGAIPRFLHVFASARFAPSYQWTSESGFDGAGVTEIPTLPAGNDFGWYPVVALGEFSIPAGPAQFSIEARASYTLTGSPGPLQLGGTLFVWMFG